MFWLGILLKKFLSVNRISQTLWKYEIKITDIDEISNVLSIPVLKVIKKCYCIVYICLQNGILKQESVNSMFFYINPPATIFVGNPPYSFCLIS